MTQIQGKKYMITYHTNLLENYDLSLSRNKPWLITGETVLNKDAQYDIKESL